MDVKKYEDLFKNKTLIQTVDELGKRYGKLPTEILMEQSIFDFQLNSAIMMASMAYANEPTEEQTEKGKKIVNNAFKKTSATESDIEKIKQFKKETGEHGS